jgi:phytoene dehydrogenase-like protein
MSSASADSRYDAVVVGAGHNGLTAALYLADAGIRPLVLERNDEVGGAVRSGEITEEGFVHDIYSTNQNLFLASHVFDDFGEELTAEGLEFSVTDRPFCNVFPDGTCLRVYGDEERTFEELEAHHPADLAGWQDLYVQFGRFAEQLLPLLDAPLPSAKAGRILASALREEGLTGLAELGQLALKSPRELGNTYFETDEAKVLVGAWGLHLDFGPDISGGAMIPVLESFNAMREGMAMCTGGASRIPESLAALVEARGGEVRTGAEVTRIDVRAGRVAAVETAEGDRIRTDTVVANLTPEPLFGDLVPDHAVPESFAESVDAYEYGPGTMMIHLSMDALPDWTAGDDLDQFMYVHVAPYLSNIAETYTDAINGQIPESPMVVVGQTTAVDPSRTPGDEHILWLQVRALPSTIEGDAAGEIDATDWAEAKDPVAERVLDKVEAYAPGFRELIRERVVISPADLERSNPNLVGGDNNGGSHHLSQYFLWRPVPGWSRYEMPVEGLYMVGAGTWPGGGNNATSGYLAAQRILRPGVGQRVRTSAQTAVGRVLGSIGR